MIAEAWKNKWNRKLEIAKIEREVKIKTLISERAHNVAMTSIDNKKLISGDAPEYREIFDKAYSEGIKQYGL